VKSLEAGMCPKVQSRECAVQFYIHFLFVIADMSHKYNITSLLLLLPRVRGA
jgi:hypothetical protein